ncbi:putative receptor protein kinase ZmPK1 [Bidens hawaiensis]|uniref:putative receptor protein kinase ZmPK1 n=1 Tax=Bidens hawaiensis TaxID=980011 RepID=UPI00404B21A4
MPAPFHLLHHHHNYITIFFFFLLLLLFFPIHSLTPGSSVSVENTDDIITSPNSLFTAGFHKVGDNAYCFAIWFSDHLPTTSRTIVWMANRDEPVNGKHSKLSLQKDGNLVLTDAGRYIIWSTQTRSNNSMNLQLHDTGNLILQEQGTLVWQSFDHPTDTLLPNQPFTKNTQLVASTSPTNYSSGFYKLFFDTDSILRLHYDSLETTTIFWPDPSLRPWEVGRYQYLYSQRASLDSQGRFNSTDGLGFVSADFGYGPQRMMKIDMDGNLRLYSLVKHGTSMEWKVQWQAVSHSCRIHGVCGQNSLCTYSQDSGRTCTCLHGYKMVNSKDWSYGCEPDFKVCKPEDKDFVELRYVEFYSYDIRYHRNYTLDACKNNCLHDCACQGFQFGYDDDGTYYCYIKTILYNGYQMGFYNPMYIKLPKTLVSSFQQKPIKYKSSFHCSNPITVTPIIRSYENRPDNKMIPFLLIIGCVIGFIEIICILFFWIKTHRTSVRTNQSYYYSPAVTPFRKFTYSELKKATSNFRHEIGRGAAGVVYKGRLADNRISAIKKLKSISNHQNEDEFQAEISTIGRLNHKNLTETWGYCAEGQHRLIVYEYMENGSLAENLRLRKLNWDTLLDVVKGTVKGLAYLHEECLEWVLHCDVKPHNILLDGNYNPKVADFGLSRVLDRGDVKNSRFSTTRGTRGYMAPEWVFKLPITSKVDVFSYGVVVLEMITGRGPGGKKERMDEDGETEAGVVEWVRNRVSELEGNGSESWVEDVANGTISGVFDRGMVEKLIRIALLCAEDDMEVRPSKSQVVNMLLDQVNSR